MDEGFKKDSYINGINNILGFNFIDEDFSWLYTTREIEQIYKELLEGKRPVVFKSTEDLEANKPDEQCAIGGFINIFPMFYADSEVEARTYCRGQERNR